MSFLGWFTGVVGLRFILVYSCGRLRYGGLLIDAGIGLVPRSTSDSSLYFVCAREPDSMPTLNTIFCWMNSAVATVRWSACW